MCALAGCTDDDGGGSERSSLAAAEHVHSAYGVYVCGAVLDFFADEVDLGLEDGALTLPEGARFEDAENCGGAPGSVRVLTWDGPDDPSPEAHRDDLGELPVGEDGGVLAVVFAPDDADVPPPRSIAVLADAPDLHPS